MLLGESRISNLTPSDIEMFARFRVPAELLAGVVIRVTADEAREYGVNLKKSGLLFLYFRPSTGQRVGCRLRPDDPDVDKKYLSPYGDKRHLFILPSAAPLLADKTTPVVLVESEKSVLALTAWAQRVGRKLLPIATGGCWSWKGRDRVESPHGGLTDISRPLPDMGVCNGRKVYVLLDANVATNRSVQQAQAALVHELRKRQADVVVLNLPVEDGVNGPDDFLAVHDDAALSALFDNVVNGGQLLEDLAAYFRKYVRVIEEAYIVLAVWVLHCHAFKAFTRTPYLHIKSPTAQCGKTQLLEVAKLVLPDYAQMACSMTAAVLARFTDKYHAPLLLDEVDKLKAGDKDLYNAVIGIVNGGYKASGTRMLLVPAKGGDWELKNLSTFSPKMLAGISGLEPATASRCIPIHMERLLPNDSVEDMDEWIVEPEAAEFQKRATAWAAANVQVLAQARPEAQGLHNRQREVSRPLFAVADLVGGDWPEKIRAAVKRLFQAQDAAPDDDIKIELLADIKEVLEDKDRIASADLRQALNAMEDRPWATWPKGTGKGINQNQLAQLLKDFKIYPRPMRLEDGRRLNGYERTWFESAWGRYLPHTDTQTMTPRQPAFLQGETQLSNRDKKINVMVEKCEKPAPILHCHGVTDEKGGRGVLGAETTPANGKAKCLIPSCREAAQANSPHCAQHQPSLFDAPPWVNLGDMVALEQRVREGKPVTGAEAVTYQLSLAWLKQVKRVKAANKN